MTLRITRLLLWLATAMFAGLALGIWLFPESAARMLGIELLSPAGAGNVRADIGGLFAGIALLCGVAAWTRRRSWIVAAGVMLASVVVGRVLGWFNIGRIGADVILAAAEGGLVALLWMYARSVATAGSASPERAASTASAGSRRRTWLLAATVTVLVLSAVAFALTPGVEQRLFEAGARRLTSSVNTAPLEDDALRVAVCGSSAPLPSASRAKACVAVFAGGRFYVVDTGPESVESLVLWGIPLKSVGAVFLTHFHSDHIGDLGELNLQTWAGGRTSPLHVYGGPGIDRVVAGFTEAYRLDQGYRTAHHTERVMPSAVWPMVAHTITLDGPAQPAKDRTAVAFEDGDLRVTAIEVDHAPIEPAYAYRFDYKGRSVLITGDLKYHPPLAAAARGVDVLVSEAIVPSMTRVLGAGARDAGRENTAAVMHDIEDYHITPQQAAELANAAGVRLLAFYHLLPAPDNALARRVFARGVDQARKGDWTIADDGSLYTLPIGATTILRGSMVD
jgi:ribonuclease Z